MFDNLSTRLQGVFKTLRGQTRLTPENIEAALREIRLALLEADVNFKVVKAFIDRVRDQQPRRRRRRCKFCEARSPAQQVVRIVPTKWSPCSATRKAGFSRTVKRPRVVLMLGLQGAGKTTTSAKLARWLKWQGKHPLLVSTDVGRPAAIQQLKIVGGESRRSRARSGGGDGTGGARQGRSGRSDQSGARHGDCRHRGPSAHRRRADGRAARRSRRTTSRQIDCSWPTR